MRLILSIQLFLLGVAQTGYGQSIPPGIFHVCQLQFSEAINTLEADELANYTSVKYLSYAYTGYCLVHFNEATYHQFAKRQDALLDGVDEQLKKNSADFYCSKLDIHIHHLFIDALARNYLGVLSHFTWFTYYFERVNNKFPADHRIFKYDAFKYFFYVLLSNELDGHIFGFTDSKADARIFHSLMAYMNESSAYEEKMEGMIISLMMKLYVDNQEVTLHTKENYLHYPVVRFFTMLEYLNQYESTKVIAMIEKFGDENNSQFPYFQYFYGQALLFQLSPGSVKVLEDFVTNNKSELLQLSGLNQLNRACLIFDKPMKYKNSPFIRKGAVWLEIDKYARQELNIGYQHKGLLSARLLYDGGSLKSALEYLNDSINAHLLADTLKPEYYYRLGNTLYALKRYDEATEALTKVISLDEMNKSASYYVPKSCLMLGMIYQLKNNVNEAHTYYLRAINYDDYIYEKSIKNEAENRLKNLP
ncbi:MAG: tetratricopeptide repeat protein [Bacteroidetes bacterium]|jgi:predicted negative regulator of RcsB-dependent stress response|nr:tetratricopeptide repeat protein [Bacteroidota bacterium]